MTETIVSELEPELGDAERSRSQRRPPESLDAWDLYQRGLWHYWRWTREDSAEAQRLLERTIEIDPGFSPAHAVLAMVHLVYVLFGWTDKPAEAVARAYEAAQQAVALDDKDPLAHFALGRVYTLQGQFEPAIAELRKSLELNPNSARAHFGLGFALHWCGRAGEALVHCKHAIRQSPNDPLRWAFEDMVGSICLVLGEHEQAIEWCSRACRHPTCSFWSHVNLAQAYSALDRIDEARAEIDLALSKNPNLTISSAATMLRNLHPDYKEPYLAVLRTLGLPE